MSTPTNIKTGLNPEFPLAFAQAENGFIYGVNGVDAPLKWDGVDSAAQAVGVDAPTTAPVLQGATSITQTTLVTSSGGLNPRSIAVDETNDKLYVTYENAAWNRIKSYNLSGGGATDVVLSADRPESIQIDPATGFIYWTAVNGGGANGRLKRATLAGASVTNLLTGRTLPRGLTLDSQNGHLYWVENAATIYRCNLNGGDVQTIYAATNAYGIAIDVANLHLFYGTTTGFIARVGTDGSGAVNLATGLGQIVDLKIDVVDQKLYAADFSNDKIYRMNLDGSGFETLFTSIGGVYGLVPSRENAKLYFVDVTNSEVLSGALRHLTGTYTAYLRFLDGDGNPSSLSPISNEINVSGASSFEYSSIQAASSPVTTRQILRSLNGSNLIYYVDVETSDLSTTTFSSTKTDDDLAAGEAVALFDSDGNSLDSRYGLPPEDRAVVVEHSSRLFLAAPVIYEGTCTITNGSAAVTGINTAFTDSMEGRAFRLKGQSTTYEVSDVSSGTALTLTAVFAGTTGYYEFEITSQPATRNTVYPSEVGPTFDGYNSLNAVEIGDPNDQVTALLSASSYLYVFQRNSTFRLTYQDQPADGTSFLEFRRGAVSQRCMAQVGNDTYILDERGIYRFGGGGIEEISSPIQVLFRQRVVAHHIPRIAWDQRKFFHASVDLAEEIVRFFVCLGHTYYPQHALCYRFTSQEWFIEEYAFPVPASSPLFGVPAIPGVGASANRILALVPNELDGVSHDAGTTRIRLTGATPLTLSFASSTTLPSSCLGVPVSVVSGRGVGQTRIIVATAAGSITINKPWSIRPESGSVIQIGAIPWKWRSRRFTRVPKSQDQSLEVYFVPQSEGTMRMRTYDDFSDRPTLMAADYGEFPVTSDGLRIRRGYPDAEVDLSTDDGYVEWERTESSIQDARSGGTYQLELLGAGSRDPLRLRSLGVSGVMEGRA
jgi:hypothetical protein